MSFVPPAAIDHRRCAAGADAQAARRVFPSSVTVTSSKMASASSFPFASAVSPLTKVYDRFSQWKTTLGLSNPGTVENLTKEVKCELRPCITTLPTLLFPRDGSFHTSYTLAFRVTRN